MTHHWLTSIIGHVWRNYWNGLARKLHLLRLIDIQERIDFKISKQRIRLSGELWLFNEVYLRIIVSNFHRDEMISPDCKGKTIELKFIRIGSRQMFVQSLAIWQTLKFFAWTLKVSISFHMQSFQLMWVSQECHPSFDKNKENIHSLTKVFEFNLEFFKQEFKQLDQENLSMNEYRPGIPWHAFPVWLAWTGSHKFQHQANLPLASNWA